MAYTLTREALLLDLYAAFHCARQHKASRLYVQHFERNLDENLRSLADDLYSRNYTPEPSSCFIVERPKKREVFAAQFRDRVVHHLYYNYTHQLFERTFIEDCYSCIPGRGTHFGIERISRHIRSASDNYRHTCYAMSLDIRGYFMHIDRQLLADIACNTINRMASHRMNRKSPQRWRDWIDIEFLTWLTREISLLDPKTCCNIVGDPSDWDTLDRNKSLFFTGDGCGLPIGNLTSQLLSNVYLNEFDQFMKRQMHCRYYGRYVDDACVISRDRQQLKRMVPAIRAFLSQQMKLDLHMGKLKIAEVHQGVEFLGAFIREGRTYPSSASLRRTIRNFKAMNATNLQTIEQSVNSFLGLLSHYNCYNIRARMFLTPALLSVGSFDRSITRFSLQ